MRYVLPLTEIISAKREELGGKGLSLFLLSKAGFQVPASVFILSGAFESYIVENGLLEAIIKYNNLDSMHAVEKDSERLRNKILRGKISKHIMEELVVALETINTNKIAIRSSAAGEDSPLHSFAGLHDTFLNVSREKRSVETHIRKCWASLFNQRAALYRWKNKLCGRLLMAVVLQEMIQPRISGVAFTCHPMSSQHILLEAFYGLGDALVSGKVTPTAYSIHRDTLDDSQNFKVKSEKSFEVAAARNRLSTCEFPAASDDPVLSDKQIKQICRVVMDIEKLFGRPQDIEWCLVNEELWILQSRPITVLKS